MAKKIKDVGNIVNWNDYKQYAKASSDIIKKDIEEAEQVAKEISSVIIRHLPQPR